MAKPKVLVTRRWPDAVEAKLCEKFDVVVNRSDAPLSAADLRGAMTSYDAIIPTVTDTFGPRTMDVARPSAKILANSGTGCSHIDLAGASAHGITVTNTPDMVAECTADLAMTLMLMAARRAGEGERELRTGNWGGWSPSPFVGTKVSGKVIGIVGFGRIGQQLARRAHHGFGMTVLVFDRSPVAPEVLAAHGARQVESLEALMPQCDFISLHVPGTRDNRNLINARMLNLMKPDGYLINTARGEIVDTLALSQALMFETIGGAGLDVVDGMPRMSDDLMQCDNLVLLPNMGVATHEAREAMGFRVLENLTSFFAGHEPADRIN